MIFYRRSIGSMLVVLLSAVITVAQGEVLNFNFNFDELLGGGGGDTTTDNNNNSSDLAVGIFIPEWLPQCFNNNNNDGSINNNPFDVVNCIEDNTLPSCLATMNLADAINDVLQCVLGSSTIEDAWDTLMEQLGTTIGDGMNNDNGEDGATDSTTTTVMTSKQGDTSEPESSGNPLEEFFSGIFGGFGGDNNEDGTNNDNDNDNPMEALMNVALAVVNTTLECLNPYAACINETIQEAIAVNLDPCINSTLTEWITCGQDNAEACLESCNNTEAPDTFLNNPFEGLILMPLDTCVDIQTNVMDPFCGLVDCCQACVPQAEALMDCLVNQQLDLVPSTGAAAEEETTYCDMTCPARRRDRRLGGDNQPQYNKEAAPRTLTSASTSSPNPEVCLQFAPGLTGTGSQELAARSGIFLPCAYDSFKLAVLNGSSATTGADAETGAEEENNEDEHQMEDADSGAEDEDNGEDENQNGTGSTGTDGDSNAEEDNGQIVTGNSGNGDDEAEETESNTNGNSAEVEEATVAAATATATSGSGRSGLLVAAASTAAGGILALADAAMFL
jgi:hypothetical protein